MLRFSLQSLFKLLKSIPEVIHETSRTSDKTTSRVPNKAPTKSTTEAPVKLFPEALVIIPTKAPAKFILKLSEAPTKHLTKFFFPNRPIFFITKTQSTCINDE